MSENVIELCEKIVKLSTKGTQKLKVMEELAELIRAVSRYMNKPDDENNINNVFEEMCDVIVVMKELELILLEDLGEDKFDEYTEKWETIKLAELEELIEKLKFKQ